MHLLLAAKCCIIVSLLVWSYWLWKAVRLGYEERKRKGATRGWIPKSHRRAAIVAYCALWVMIAFAEAAHVVARHRIGGPHGFIFLIHLPFAITVLASMSTMLWKNGMESPDLHRALAYLTVFCAPIVAITGLILALEL